MPNQEKSVKFVVYALFMAIAVDMGGEIGLRDPVVGASLLALVYTKQPPISRTTLIYAALLIAYPLALGIMLLGHPRDLSVGISQLQSTILGFAILYALSTIDQEQIAQAFLTGMTLVATLTCAIGIGILLAVTGAEWIAATLASLKAGYFGERLLNSESIVPNVYFKSTLFMPAALALGLYYKRYVASAVLIAAQVFAISKAGIIASGLIITVHMLTASTSIGKRATLGAIFAIATYTIAQLPIFQEISSTLAGESHTVSVRIQHFESLLKYWHENPALLMFGAGPGSEIFTSAEGKYVTNIELDHLNTVRKYGLVWFMALFAPYLTTTLNNVLSSTPYRRYIGVACIFSFILAGTNPVLISPMFFCLIALCNSKQNEHSYR
jgi:hypothetical protein